MKKILAVSLSVLGLIAQAQAATVTREAGVVSVSHGSKYTAVKGTQSANPGDLVRTGKNSRAVIVLDCGDRFEVEPGRVTRVPPEACSTPAETATAPATLASPMVLAAGAAAAVGVGAAAAATNGFSGGGNNGDNGAGTVALLRAQQCAMSGAKC